MKKQTAKRTGISNAFLFKFIDCKSLFFFSLFLLLKKWEKNTLFKKKEMSLDSYTEKRKLNSALPSEPAAPRVQAGRLSGGDEGSSSWPLPSSGSGENPHLLTIPPPLTPELLILESILELEGNEECGKYLKAAAVPGRLLGAAWGGSRGRVVPRDRVEMLPPGSRPPGPTQRGQRHLEPVESGQGDHGFRLHSGQSFPGTPGQPGSRTGTRPPSAPWLASGSAASSPSGRCRPHLRTASAPARC